MKTGSGKGFAVSRRAQKIGTAEGLPAHYYLFVVLETLHAVCQPYDRAAELDGLT